MVKTTAFALFAAILVSPAAATVSSDDPRSFQPFFNMKISERVYVRSKSNWRRPSPFHETQMASQARRASKFCDLSP